MNQAQLLEHFDRISEAPDAVARLRRFILDLAVRGKLVEQDPNDEPASELLKRIQAERSKKVMQQSPVAPKELPFALPPGWSWTRFGEVFSLEYGDNLPADKRTNTGEYPVYGSNGIVGSHFECFVHSPCIVVGRKGSAGALNLSLSDGCCVTDVAYYCIPPSGLDMAFSFKLFHTLGLDSLGKGVKPGLSRNEAYVLPIAIPPLAEQHRIVAKVDELMVLCDQLEAAKNEREARRDRLVAASLHRIGTAPAAADEDATEAQNATPLRDAARFHLDHLPRLTTRPEHIKQLRQAILGLVFQGCLTSRLDEDGLGTDLVNEIHRQLDAEESTKARAGKSKPTEQFECDPAFSAPETWGWIRLQLLCEQIGDIDHKMPRAVTAGVPFLSAKDLKDSGELDFSDPKYISEEDFIRLSRKVLPRRDDIIYSRIGAKLGKARLVEVDTRFLISYSCCLIRPKHQFVDKRFLQIFLDSHLALRQAHSGIQSIGVPDLGLGEIKAYRIPMPPLAEQYRIVAKVDELMALCDQLEAQLTVTQTDSRRLLEAVLHEALAPALEKAA